MYPKPQVSQFVVDNFVPVRQHVKTHPDAMGRFDVQWTPTILILDSGGKERHRIEGFLETEPFLAQLRLGLGKVAMANQRLDEAERVFEEAAATGDADVAPEAAYWAGVSRYKRTNDPSHLGATYKRLSGDYAGSTWAKKASIWG